MSTTTTDTRLGRTAHLAYAGHSIKLTVVTVGSRLPYDTYTYEITAPDGTVTLGRVTPRTMETAVADAVRDVETLIEQREAKE